MSRDNDEPLESAAGDRDNPDAAYQWRYAILAGNQRNVDFQQKRREAVTYTAQKMKKSGALRKTSAASWSALGPGNIGGRVRSIVINPQNSAEILIGSVSGGIWKTTDDGATWTPRSDSLDVMAIGSMVVDPTNGNVVYAGTGEGWLNEDAVYGGGIYKTTDFGDTWTLLPSTTGASVEDFRDVMKITADPAGNIYAATKDYTYKYGGGEYTLSGGLFMSTDGGTSWAKISSTDQSTNYFTPDDVVAVSSSTIVFSVESNGLTRGGIYRTTNGGATWSKDTLHMPSSNYGRIAMTQDPTTPNTLYAVFESLDLSASGDGGLKGIFKSTDAGASWSQLTSPPKLQSTGGLSYLKDQGWYDNVIAVDPNNSDNIYVGGIDLMKSTNGGSSWAQISYWDLFYGAPYVHCDHHAIVFDKNNPNTIIEGNDGGVYRTTNGGSTWTNLNNGLAITQFYSGAVFASGPTYYGGTQDNGHLKYSGNGSVWIEAASGDGGYSAQDQTNNSIAYEEYVNLAMAKTTDGGVTWNNCTTGLSDANDQNKSLFIAPFTMNPENSAVLLAGSNRVWFTNNSAGTWTAASGVLSSNYHVSAVTIVNGTTNYLAFAGTTSGKIFRCTDLNPAAGDSSWQEITPPGNNGGWVRRITIDPGNKSRLFACYGGYNTSGTLASRHIWYSTDQGGTWSDVSLTLPNVPVHSLVLDPDNPSTVYCGTETGVYTSMDNGTTWSPFNSGMPLYVPTDELVIQSGTKAIFAFTHGRGAFSTAPSLNVSPGWTGQNSGVNTELYTVKAVSQSVAWAAGSEGQVLATTDGGTNWKPAGGGPIGSADIYTVSALDANTAFVSSTPDSITYIYRTTNGGSTWTQVYSLVDGFIDGIKMIDANNGIAVGDPVGGKWTILRTTDGGATWGRIATEPAQAGEEAGWNNAVAVFGTSDIWFGTNASSIYHSTDGGASWSSAQVPFGNCVSVSFNSAAYGVAGSDSNTAVRTTDGGNTWTPISIGGSGFVGGVSGAGVDFYAAEGGSVYHSSDRGATWTASFTGSIGSLNHLDFASNGSSAFGWIVSSSGDIAAFSGALSGVERTVSTVPSEFVLGQNYPNPFNPSTKIDFQIPAQSRVLLVVYNSLGEEVATLVDNFMTAGTHSVEWNGMNRFNASAASGVYFYRLTAGKFVQTKKMLLVK
ncbi:MAG TPA: T9SS type A sorting domain-containing protein [Bacteroidota bacterium]|nr:T9SS type A sorting domain-containing protein [Bacteroidota bacterium]